eukprot:jgi/Chrzof1/2357/Cz11g12050.t1
MSQVFRGLQELLRSHGSACCDVLHGRQASLNSWLQHAAEHCQSADVPALRNLLLAIHSLEAAGCYRRPEGCKALQVIVDTLASQVANGIEVTSRSTAACLYAVVRVGCCPSNKQLHAVVSKCVQLTAQEQPIRPIDVATMMWAVSKMAGPQHIGMVLPSETSMQATSTCNLRLQLPAQHIKDLMRFTKLLSERLVSMFPATSGESISRALLALANLSTLPRMQQTAKDSALQIIQHVQPSQFDNLDPLSQCIILQACCTMRLRHDTFLSKLAASSRPNKMSPAHLSNMAYRLGRLGYTDTRLVAAVAEQMCILVLDKPAASQTFACQDISKLLWAAAVGNMQQLVPQLQALCGALVEQRWHDVKEEELSQLLAVNIWLCDNGLPGIMDEQKTEQCKEAFLKLQDAQHTSFAEQVFQSARRLQQKRPHDQQGNKLCLTGLVREKCTTDGLFTVDIMAKSASKGLVAIEADGPTHFTFPDLQLTGRTQLRNRALAARGYQVISIPYHEWRDLTTTEQDGYLASTIIKALQ